MVEDFVKMVDEFQPHLIGLSCVESTVITGVKLLESVQYQGIPNLVGGCIATFAPEKVLEFEVVDMVCVGEGEKTIVDLSERLSRNEPITDVPNLWVRENGTIVQSKNTHLCKVEEINIPRFDVFAPERIYRPMSGKLYRMLPVEFSRGCPYRCTYCSAPTYNTKFKHVGHWLRYKSMDQIMKEIEFYVKEYDAEYFYFISETFLATSKKKRKEFYEWYKEFKIPFWCNTRPETISVWDIENLQEIGCHRMSIGIESGNEEFRYKSLKRNYTNEQVLKAVNIVTKYGIEFSVNNMIGFPDETREMIFDTIELNRQFKADSHTVSIFQPFMGTELYDYAVEKGYYNSKGLGIQSFSEPVMTMPHLSNEEIVGLYRTFNLYLKADKSMYPEIRKAEALDEAGNERFFSLSEQLKN